MKQELNPRSRDHRSPVTEAENKLQQTPTLNASEILTPNKNHETRSRHQFPEILLRDENRNEQGSKQKHSFGLSNLTEGKDKSKVEHKQSADSFLTEVLNRFENRGFFYIQKLIDRTILQINPAPNQNEINYFQYTFKQEVYDFFCYKVKFLYETEFLDKHKSLLVSDFTQTLHENILNLIEEIGLGLKLKIVDLQRPISPDMKGTYDYSHLDSGPLRNHDLTSCAGAFLFGLHNELQQIDINQGEIKSIYLNTYIQIEENPLNQALASSRETTWQYFLTLLKHSQKNLNMSGRVFGSPAK